jgi:hypothetical protein
MSWVDIARLYDEKGHRTYSQVGNAVDLPFKTRLLGSIRSRLPSDTLSTFRKT